MYLLRVLSEQPRLNDVYTFSKSVWVRLNDLVLNIDTEPDVALSTLMKHGRPYLQGAFSEKAKHHDNKWYESPDYWYIRKAASIIDPRPETDVLYDLGSGKGRILCEMARRPFKKVVGVELFEALCEAAKRNAARVRGRKAPIEIVCDDATRVDLAEATVYFMFNPFGIDTMRDVVGNIGQSLATNPRRIIVVYYNDVHADVLSACEWLRRYHVFHTATGCRVSFWRSPDVDTASIGA